VSTATSSAPAPIPQVALATPVAQAAASATSQALAATRPTVDAVAATATEAAQVTNVALSGAAAVTHVSVTVVRDAAPALREAAAPPLTVTPASGESKGAKQRPQRAGARSTATTRRTAPGGGIGSAAAAPVPATVPAPVGASVPGAASSNAAAEPRHMRANGNGRAPQRSAPTTPAPTFSFAPVSGARTNAGPAARRASHDDRQGPPLPWRQDAPGSAGGAAGVGGAGLVLFAGLLSIFSLAIPKMGRWLRPVTALGLSPSYVTLGERPG
jgi:hypothetical protein